MALSSEVKAYLYKSFDEDVPEGTSRSLMMTVAAGEGTYGPDKKYKLAHSLGGTPIITSDQTGRRFVLPWETIITLAVQAGIDVTTAKKEKAIAGKSS